MSYRVFVCLLKNRVEIKTMIKYTVNVCNKYAKCTVVSDIEVQSPCKKA